jgi:hypothetical protein
VVVTFWTVPPVMGVVGWSGWPSSSVTVVGSRVPEVKHASVAALPIAKGVSFTEGR